MNRIGIDLGGTKIEAILLSSANKVVERRRIPTNQQDGYEAIIERIINLTKKVRTKAKQE
nr:ROK family protein [Candidatus Neomarinimicrobiota bacterium]